MQSSLLSAEGATQGDPLAMPMYALATVPLINNLASSDVSQVWYADDASATGDLVGIRSWWDHLLALGPKFGYFPNGLKSWLVVKEDFRPLAESLFNDTDVQIC